MTKIKKEKVQRGVSVDWNKGKRPSSHVGDPHDSRSFPIFLPAITSKYFFLSFLKKNFSVGEENSPTVNES